ncbi:Acetophenone carboxylase gamma subunit [Mucisphaera calidilacus]|uniref:Acetophenone carboxylase gamma subunit n=2 Tax=Mucisphaera calidilacus TaxID=2527982 RepID=A0A518BY21_9BACT|nr:Acetophenone carboxylase gamma subunit [Mucisphaera calidilacus]
MRIGVDTGGTFTDLILANATGDIVATHKLLSTPDDPGRAVVDGIEALLAEVGADHQPHVVHGSTVATNALLEGKVARAALITTTGFEDVLRIARQNRPSLFALVPQKPAPVIDRGRTVGIKQRTGPEGQTISPMDPASVSEAVETLAGLRLESIAICLLHSYANPDDERRVARAVRERFGDAVHLTVSHELLPEWREYERTSTCAINAAVAPRMNGYVQRLAARLGPDRLSIMASHAGTLAVEEVGDQPVRTILSGPAGGALGALAVARSLGHERIITFDMGGTSTDVALLDGEPGLTTEGEAAGMPVRLPMVDLHTVGAGGGSMAWVDDGGALRVGPESCGADPGPACYGRQAGDLVPAVTDAHAVLGNLPRDIKLAGRMDLEVAAAESAVDNIAHKLGLGRIETAEGILAVAESTMARAIRKVSLERGHDPSEYAMVSFGGAGGLHACRLAEALGMSRIIVPAHAGLLSAVGMLTAARSLTFSIAVVRTLDDATCEAARRPGVLASQILPEAAASLEKQALAWFSRYGVPETDRGRRWQADLRYHGQSFEITVDLDNTDPIASFESEHERLYGYNPEGRAIEVVTLRETASGAAGTINFPEIQTPQTAAGPAILRDRSSTLLVREGWRASTSAEGHTMLTRMNGAAS